ncbi:MAG: helix-turn-helix domain-containing protein [Planctomycetota bacterium]
MLSSDPQTLIQQLQSRRKTLGMTYATLARRSGVSVATVERALSNRPYKVGLEDVLAIASALGMNLQLQEDTDPVEMVRRQAENKARKLVDMVQGTCLLEAQGIDNDQRQQMIREATLQLLNSPRRRLWEVL